MAAIEGFEALSRQVSVLRDQASLEASYAELQEAAGFGELVAWKRLKLHSAEGHVWYEAGDPVPIDDPQHRLLQPRVRLLTTVARWEAKQAFSELLAYLRNGHQLAKDYTVAQDKTQRAAAKIADLESQLAEAKAAMKDAQKAEKDADKALQAFVDKAPKTADVLA